MKTQIVIECVENGFLVKFVENLPGDGSGSISGLMGSRLKETIWICSTGDDVADRVKRLLP